MPSCCIATDNSLLYDEDIRVVAVLLVINYCGLRLSDSNTNNAMLQITHYCMMRTLALNVSYRSYTWMRCMCWRLWRVLNSISTASRLTIRLGIILAASSCPEHLWIQRLTTPKRPLGQKNVIKYYLWQMLHLNSIKTPKWFLGKMCHVNILYHHHIKKPLMTKYVQ